MSSFFLSLSDALFVFFDAKRRNEEELQEEEGKRS